MIINGKEYPATHSMSTSWFFVDKDDNVAIFDFQDNGPIPDATGGREYSPEEFCFDDAAVEKEGMKVLPYTDEQILDLMEGAWETAVKEDHYWSSDVFQIDISKERFFFDFLTAARKHMKKEWGDSFIPVCFSKKLGIYLVDLDAYDFGEGLRNPYAKYLFDNGIVKRFGQCPSYYDTEIKWDFNDPAGAGKEMAKRTHCPYYLYTGQYDARLPHVLVSNPKRPMKLSQLPPQFKDKYTRVNLKFKDSPVIQITRECPCYSSVGYQKHVGSLYTLDGDEYIEVFMPNGEIKFALNGYDSSKHPIPEHLPVAPSDDYIEHLKSLAINRSFVSIKQYYND